MKLKTYTAETMAQALAQVRKDLGKDAMILHTRSFRVGAWFGIGGKNMVEITASTANVSKSKPRAMPRVASAQPQTTRSLAGTVGRAPEQMIESKPIRSSTVQTALHNERQPEIVIQRGRTVTRQRLAHANTPSVPSAGSNGYTSHDDDRAALSDPNADDVRGLDGRDAMFPEKPIKKKPSVPSESKSDSRMIDPPQVFIPSSKINRRVSTAQSEQNINRDPSPTTQDKQDTQTNDQLRTQIDSLQKMMGQVLESTRKTAVAIGTTNPEAALPTGEMPVPLFNLYSNMIDNDVPVDLADKLVGKVRDRLDAIELKDPIVVRQSLLREIESTIRTRSESLLTLEPKSSNDRPRVIALVGPTGVGKTTTVAKLAATYKLRHGKTVGLITSDTYRIAAVEQLRTYAGIIGLPLKIANSPEELSNAIIELGDCDIVVIDTAGRSQNNTKRLEELAEFTRAANPDETHLVLSTTVGDNVLRKTAQRFEALGPDRCILTKLDEAVTTGPIAGLCDRIGLPLSFITIGQEVPDDLEPARADRLARCVLDGPEAVVMRSSEDNG